MVPQEVLFKQTPAGGPFAAWAPLVLMFSGGAKTNLVVTDVYKTGLIKGIDQVVVEVFK
jgi:hypothetical protein